ncbi:dethiobiotin synthase [Actinokineospora sp. NBRC 105648]|uniref:dethiobiotin synthase n=1 Tax=Actinokineospora sp. NBRC 105648 TaxID=3032206 RepID=UPI0024A06824|nr:dethiobiotin synthase [Actinokineospora sp. NBRC 105648]GLZ42131.1 ATP-dependent dethiobiotin synthetase BioD [Actinokineospora sp. NBRC 105648]
MSVLVITGTGTGVGKTVVTAGIAALARSARRRVAVLKPAQTGVAAAEPGDLADVVRLAGEVTTRELRRFAEPLAPDTAARRAGMPPVRPSEVASAAVELDQDHDLVLVEGAGGLLVRFDPDGGTLADVAWALGAAVVVVAHAGLGTLNTAALTAEALRRRGVTCAGIVIGSWPAEPDLASRCNVEDLPEVAQAPLVGAFPEGSGALSATEFAEVARRALAPSLGGEFDAKDFADAHPA